MLGVVLKIVLLESCISDELAGDDAMLCFGGAKMLK